jgi:hypothetical protein
VGSSQGLKTLLLEKKDGAWLAKTVNIASLCSVIDTLFMLVIMQMF